MSSKKYSKETEELAVFGKAFSHPARIEILKTLAEKKSCMCGEIVDVMPLAQSTVSQHLKELKKSGIIIGEIDGPKSCYCINQERFKQMIKFFKEFVEKTSCC